MQEIPRDKKGRFVAYKIGARRYAAKDIQEAFMAGLNNQDRFQLPSKKAELYLKSKNIF